MAAEAEISQSEELYDIISSKKDAELTFRFLSRTKNGTFDPNYIVSRKNSKGEIVKTTLLRESIYAGRPEITKFLLEAGADPNFTTEGFPYPLHYAVSLGSRQTKLLLAARDPPGINANPNIKDKLGDTPLHIAARNNNVDMVKLLLQFGADKTLENLSGQTPEDVAGEEAKTALNWVKDAVPAASSSKESYMSLADAINEYTRRKLPQESFIEVLKRSNPDSPDIHGRSHLFTAVENGDHDVVRLLLEHGASPNFVDENGNVPLQGISEKTALVTVKLLLEKGAIWDPTNKALLKSVILESIPTVLDLLTSSDTPSKPYIKHDFGNNLPTTSWYLYEFVGLFNRIIDMNRYDSLKVLAANNVIEKSTFIEAGNKVLFYAIQKLRARILRIFLEIGCNPNKMNEKGETLRDFTESLDGYSLSYRYKYQFESYKERLLEVLRNFGAKYNPKKEAEIFERNRKYQEDTKNSKAVFNELSSARQARVDENKIIEMMKEGLNPTYWDSFEGKSVSLLDLAENKRAYVVFERLLELGAGPYNAFLHKAAEGFYPLRDAEHDLKIVKLLLEHGANVFGKDKWGFTPYQLARKEGNTELANIFLEYQNKHPQKNNSASSSASNSSSSTSNASSSASNASSSASNSYSSASNAGDAIRSLLIACKQGDKALVSSILSEHPNFQRVKTASGLSLSQFSKNHDQHHLLPLFSSKNKK